MSSVLNYNDLDLSPVLKNNKEDMGNDEDEDDPEEERHHESTFTKQFLYFLLMTWGRDTSYTKIMCYDY